MLLHLHGQGPAVQLDGKGLVDTGQGALGKLHVDHRAGDPGNDPMVHVISPSFSVRFFCRARARAPAETSVISWVMAAWRARLYSRDS